MRKMRYYAEVWTLYNLVSVWWMYGFLDEIVLHIFQKLYYLKIWYFCESKHLNHFFNHQYNFLNITLFLIRSPKLFCIRKSLTVHVLQLFHSLQSLAPVLPWVYIKKIWLCIHLNCRHMQYRSFLYLTTSITNYILNSLFFNQFNMYILIVLCIYTLKQMRRNRGSY